MEKCRKVGRVTKEEDNGAKQLKACTIDNLLRPWNRTLIKKGINEEWIAVERLNAEREMEPLFLLRQHDFSPTCRIPEWKIARQFLPVTRKQIKLSQARNFFHITQVWNNLLLP